MQMGSLSDSENDPYVYNSFHLNLTSIIVRWKFPFTKTTYRVSHKKQGHKNTDENGAIWKYVLNKGTLLS